MRLAISKDGASFSESKIIPTPKDFWEGMDAFKKAARELIKGEELEAAGGGVAGPMDRDHTMIVGAPNIPEWNDKPLKEELERTLSCPVYLENDTAIVGLGEATVGAGRGRSIVVYVTISTGVNGVRIIDGRIAPSSMGYEIGHQIIKFDGDICESCDAEGHLEAYISGTALEKKYSKKPYEVTDPVVWEEEARLLAYGLNNVSVFWSPDIIILGGSMIVGDPAIPIDRVRHHLKNILKIYLEPPQVEKATLGDVGGLYGALEYLKQNV